MIGEQKNRDEGYVNVSTKVPPHIAELLNIIAKSRGTDIYGLLQLFIQVIIRAAKVTTKVSTDMKLLLHMLEMDANWANAYNFASPSARQDIAQIILILQQHDGQRPRNGFGLVMIDKPFMGEEARQTLCVDDILERVAEVSMVGLYKELRQIGLLYQSESLRETLTKMCDAELIEQLNQMDAQEMPQMGDFHDFGKVIEWGNKTKRKPHRTPDSVANQQLRLFDPDKPYGEQADAYMRDLERRAKEEEELLLTDTPDIRPYGEKADAYFRDLEERAKEEELGFRPFDQEY